jgi:2,5-diketo-D-gluconate reductase A
MVAPSVPSVTLNDGNSIPSVGLDAFRIPKAETEQAVGAALLVGYRHIDTPAMYGNGRKTGRAVADSGVTRDQPSVFVETFEEFAHLHDQGRTRSVGVGNADPVAGGAGCTTRPKRADRSGRGAAN